MDTATTTAKALDALHKKVKIPKLHKARKESTKTITVRLYKKWATIVHALGNHKCETCGKEHTSQAPLNAHHIMPRQMFYGLRFDPHNGISLCPKCHKMGKFSAHKGGIWFAEWLRTNRAEKYQYCINNAEKDLDCKDRNKLYEIEDNLHREYETHIGKLPYYQIIGYTKDGRRAGCVIKAATPKSAEYQFMQNWPKDEKPIKGIFKTIEVKQ